MKTIFATMIVATAAAIATPALAKTDCDSGFKTHLGKMTIYVDKMSGNDLAEVVRRSLDAYDTCKAGDDFSPHGVWDKIIEEMQSKSRG